MSTTVSNGSEEVARSRRRGIVVLCAVAVLLAMAGFFTATGQADSQAQVTFITPDNRSYAVTLESAGEPDVKDVTYRVRQMDGSIESVVVANGYSVEALTKAWSRTSSIDMTTYLYAQIPRSVGAPLVLLKQQLLNATGGQKAVVYVADDGTVRLLRPQTGPKDPNGADVVTDASNITFKLLKKYPITVKAQASPTTAKVGQTVTFSGQVKSGAASGETFKFSWNSKDSVVAGSGQTVKHKFAKRGDYKVYLFVSSDVSGKEELPVTVRVHVDPKKSTKNQDGGGTNKSDDAPDSGASDGSSGSGTGTGYSGSNDYGDTTDYTDPGTSSPVTPAPVTPPEPTPPKTETTPKPETTPKQTVPATSGETQVEGTVLTGLSLAAASVPPPSGGAASPSDTAAAKDVAAREGTPKDPADPSGGLHIPAGVWMLLLLVLLLIGGFWQDAYRAVAPRTIPRIP